MSDDDRLNQEERRLWKIEPDTKKGISIFGIVIVVVVLSFLLIVASDPCWETRMTYVWYGEEPPKMSFWQMRCEKKSGACVCRQTTGELSGGRECTLLEGELKATCVMRARLDD